MRTTLGLLNECEKADFNIANERALKVAKQLGRGWEPRVWQNGGWQFEVTKGIATVSIDDEGRYVGALVFKMSETNRVWIQQKGPDPRALVRALSVELEGKITQLQRSLMSISLDALEIE